jgi:tetratricopeptide (TPR) repeat protein
MGEGFSNNQPSGFSNAGNFAGNFSRFAPELEPKGLKGLNSAMNIQSAKTVSQKMDDKLLILDLDTFSGSERFMSGSSLGAAFSTGMRAYLDGRYSDAVAEFKTALIAAYVEGDDYTQIWERERAIIHLYLGNAYAYQDSWSNALEEYMNAVQIDGQLAEGHYNLGVAFRAMGKLYEAVAAFKVALQYNPDLYEARFALGRCYHELGDYAHAYISYTLARQLRPNAAEPIYYQGLLHQAHGETKQAAKCFAEALRVEPEYIHNTSLKEATEETDLGGEHDPSWYYRLAEELKAQGNVVGALRAYQALLQARPEESRARYFMANILARQREWERAIAEYKFVLRDDPHFIAARYKLGLAYRALQRLKESYHTLVQCARLQPNDGVVFLSLGIVLTDLGQLHLSIKAFERAAKLLPNEPQVHYRLGRALISAGFESRAMVAWQKAIELDDQWQAARYDLGLLYLKRGRYYEAATAFEAVFKAQPEDVDTAYFLGIAYKETGRLDDTIQLLERVVTARPEHHMAHFHLGATYLRMGNANEGLTHIREYERLKGVHVPGRNITTTVQPQSTAAKPEPARPQAPAKRPRLMDDDTGDLHIMQKLIAKRNAMQSQPQATAHTNGNGNGNHAQNAPLNALPAIRAVGAERSKN